MTRRRLTVALGLVWLLDAALQFQPFMFTRDFPNTVITPAGAGSPGWVHGPVDWAAALMANHIVVGNALSAVVQLAIAIGLLWPRAVRPALAASIVWAVLVWWLGEGLGGVLAGPVSPIMGLPGAVIIYALLALFAWPRNRAGGRSVAESSVLSRPGALILWVVFWAVFVFETLRPANRAPNGLRDLVTGMSDGQPGWVASINSAAGHALAGRGTGISISLAVIFAVIAVAVFAPAGLRRVALTIAVVVAAAIWIVGEDFGAIFTGQGTDPNTGPLLALFALAYWPGRRTPLATTEQAADRNRSAAFPQPNPATS